MDYKRVPAVSKRISDINPEKDIRVRLLGNIIDKADGAIVIDDGSSTAQIVTDSGETGDLVCVFARVLPLEDGYELRGEIVQQKSGLDMELYKKVYGE